MHISCRKNAALGLLVALLAAGLAAASTPRSYTLRLHQGEGNKATYAVSVVETDTLAGAEASDRKIVSRAQLTWTVTFQGVSPDGTIRAQAAIEGGPLEVQMGERSTTARVDDSVTSYTFTPRAEVKEAKLLSGSLPVVSPLGTALSADDAFVPVLLPDKPVKVGDIWQETLRIPAPTGDPQHARQIHQQSKVLREVSYAERPCLEIRTVLRQSQQLTQEAPDGSGAVPVKAEGESSITWLFDPEQGLVMKMDSEGVDSSTHPVKAAGQGLETVEIKKAVSIHSRMTEYDGRKITAQ